MGSALMRGRVDSFRLHANITTGSFYTNGNESVNVEYDSSKPLSRYFSECPLWVERGHSLMSALARK